MNNEFEVKVEPPEQKKIAIAIRIDGDVLVWYKNKMHKGGYQILINAVLRRYMELQEAK